MKNPQTCQQKVTAAVSQYVAAIKVTDSNVNIIVLNGSVSDSEMRGGSYRSPTNICTEKLDLNLKLRLH